MSEQLSTLLTQPRRPRILVFGDVMLDRYQWGEVERISPEGPIPVLRVGRQEDRLGGAGSVAAMLAALEARVILAGVVGEDAEGQAVRRALEQIGADSGGVLATADRPTTLKHRLLGTTLGRSAQQMLRVDREETARIDHPLRDRLLGFAWQQLDRVDLILVSDYDKGVCDGTTVRQLVAIAQSAGVPVLADPARGADYRRYTGCACITPNRSEASEAAGMRIRTPQDGVEAARRLLRFGVESALVTMDRDGMAWVGGAGNGAVVPARPREVTDITGAGDMVLSTLGYALACGSSLADAVELANLAGGLEVERLGVVPLTRNELLAELTRTGLPTPQKIVTAERLEAELDRRRRAGQTIVMTNGCYDLLHPGHVATLEHARAQGDCLVVGVNSDRGVGILKGPGHPIVDQQGRAETLAALACVDYVVIFDDVSVAGLVERVHPDVLVKADHYAIEKVVGHDIVRAYGGRIVLAPTKAGYSTTRLIASIRNGVRQKAS